MKEGSGQLEDGEKSTARLGSDRGLNRRLSLLDFILRVVAAIGTLGGAITMGTTEETLPFFILFVQFLAEYKDLPTFTFFVADSVVCTYLVLSLPFSIFYRIVVVIFDTSFHSMEKMYLHEMVSSMCLVLSAGSSPASDQMTSLAGSTT